MAQLAMKFIEDEKEFRRSSWSWLNRRRQQVGLYAVPSNRQPEVVKIGEKYGELTVIRLLGVRNRHRVYELRCACGRIAVRSAHSLTYSRKNNRSPCCTECRNDLWHGMIESRREAIKHRRVEDWEDGLGLYSMLDIASMLEEVWGSLEKEFGRSENRDFQATEFLSEYYVEQFRDAKDERAHNKLVEEERRAREMERAVRKNIRPLQARFFDQGMGPYDLANRQYELDCLRKFGYPFNPYSHSMSWYEEQLRERAIKAPPKTAAVAVVVVEEVVHEPELVQVTKEQLPKAIPSLSSLHPLTETEAAYIRAIFVKAKK